MDERTYVCPHCGGSGKLPARPFAPGDKLWWKGGGYGYENRIPVIAIRPTGKHSFKVSFVTARDGLTVESAARISCLTFRDDSQVNAHSAEVDRLNRIFEAGVAHGRQTPLADAGAGAGPGQVVAEPQDGLREGAGAADLHIDADGLSDSQGAIL